MNTITSLTQHARARLQQRGIPRETIDLLQQFGRRKHDHRNGVILYFDRKAKAKIAETFGKTAAQLNLSAYIVVDAANDCVITAAHRTRRFHNVA